MTTFMPAFDAARAMPRPMPSEPAVMYATLPFRSFSGGGCDTVGSGGGAGAGTRAGCRGSGRRVLREHVAREAREHQQPMPAPSAAPLEELTAIERRKPVLARLSCLSCRAHDCALRSDRVTLRKDLRFFCRCAISRG